MDVTILKTKLSVCLSVCLCVCVSGLLKENRFWLVECWTNRRVRMTSSQSLESLPPSRCRYWDTFTGNKHWWWHHTDLTVWHTLCHVNGITIVTHVIQFVSVCVSGELIPLHFSIWLSVVLFFYLERCSSSLKIFRISRKFNGYTLNWPALQICIY